MNLILIFLVSLTGFSYGNEVELSLERLLARNVNCGVAGINTPTTCISKTKFIYNHEDIATAKPISCPAGTVCADVQGICAAGIEPDCTNDDYIGVKCLRCDPYSNLACISPTAYTACVNGKPVMALARECAAPSRYCKITPNPGAALVVCIAQAVDADCKALPFHQQLQDASQQA